jgi:hypothetical protein
VSFCSREDLASREPLAGTGVRAEAYVFMPIPKRLWSSNEMNESWASPAELAAIGTARRAGVVTRLYNPPRGGDGVDAKIFVHAPANRAEPIGLAPLLATFENRWPVDRTPPPQVAVCTHGTRDRCCAKWGFAAFTTALRLFEEGRSPYEPLECSHLGGDRYAATGVFFPSGSMYAHLDSIDLAQLAQAEASGQIDPTAYRGRVFEPPLTQIVRAGLASEGLLNTATGRLLVRRPDPDGPTALVTVPDDGRTFTVALRTIEVRFFASCAKLAADKPASGRRLVYAGAQATADAATA